ncbi:tRNA (adenosine(37)-N6)-threonylcarbamoyltransferase complex ATPase subunit type 1 TsaE [soil metagenome]
MVLLFTLNEIDKAANMFISSVEHASHSVFAFHGNLGAGKTTFINALCRKYGVTGTISSPTFSIINEYKTVENKIIFHMDMYRLKDEAEAINAGVEEALNSGNLCFVEWPERAPELFHDETIHVYLEAINEVTRKLVAGNAP